MTNKHGTDIRDTLIERKLQHGPFSEHANIEVLLAEVARGRCTNMTNIQRVGLSMILHKVARVLNNGHQHSDTWHDIAGYATLVEQSILDE